MSGGARDWTQGGDAIVYQRCAACGAVRYFHRAFCARCGGTELEVKRASGRGTVYAATIVSRAATEETRAHVPYAILLVEMAEGFRIMAHGDSRLKIGDAVVGRLHEFAGKRVPYFEKDKS